MSRKERKERKQGRSRGRWLRRLVMAGGLGAVFAYRKRRLDEADRTYPPPPRG